ncbi:MAG: tetratricopeptide repeat protein [Epsilonproteobacteria bacterium]|nr:tetratricopeptide repeat protein [Campylobacterota bacterium]
MSVFAIIMFAATLYFAYQIFRHVQSLEDTLPHNKEQSTRPIDVNSLVEEADRAYEQEDFKAAQEKLGQAYLLEPQNLEILNKLAFIHGKRGDVQLAIDLYNRSLGMDENDDLVHNALASLYRTQGSLMLAKEHYEKALGIDNEYAVTYYNYANLLVDLGEKEQAEAMYLRAIELDSEMTQAHEALESLRKAQ